MNIMDETELTATVVANQRSYTVPRDVAAELSRMSEKVESLRHHVKALQMLCNGQSQPIDLNDFVREVDAIDAALSTAKPAD